MKKIILAIDDQPDMLNLIGSVLEDSEYEVRIAKTISRALSILSSTTKIDLILLDIMMPDITGIEFFQYLKTLNFSKHIPVILLTSESGQETISKALELGVQSFITKPFDPAVLHIKIKEALGQIPADF
ncbi:MAG: response regulator [Treponema sp.]|jgi:CheY-like chemotaxis protein|nr:response regulator [Treponema sp.]